jgi:hypothetical protein
MHKYCKQTGNDEEKNISVFNQIGAEQSFVHLGSGLGSDLDAWNSDPKNRPKISQT